MRVCVCVCERERKRERNREREAQTLRSSARAKRRAAMPAKAGHIVVLTAANDATFDVCRGECETICE